MSYQTLKILLVALCLAYACKRHVPHTNTSLSSNVSAAMDLPSYAQACIEAIGPIPDIDCLRSDIIPLTLNGVDISQEVLAAAKKGVVTKTICDRPSLIGMDEKVGQCVPFSRFGSVRATAGSNAHWAFLCRRVYPRTKEDPHFDQVAAIGYNVKTGATCFFNARQNQVAPSTDASGRTLDLAVDSTKIPSPAAPRAELFWESFDTVAKNGCVDCHSAAPFIRTPYVSQLQQAEYHRKQKAGTATSFLYALPTLDVDAPYYVVAKKQLEEASNARAKPRKWQPRMLNAEDAGSCNDCHRIGDRFHCKRFASLALGLYDQVRDSKVMNYRDFYS
ncbi:MAG: hypothetical protein NTV34_06270, partial [Proteobacteria bacterium]|nr:hypothetical protein [Pseudomonadota bacterium]